MKSFNGLIFVSLLSSLLLSMSLAFPRNDIADYENHESAQFDDFRAEKNHGSTSSSEHESHHESPNESAEESKKDNDENIMEETIEPAINGFQREDDETAIEDEEAMMQGLVFALRKFDSDIEQLKGKYFNLTIAQETMAQNLSSLLTSNLNIEERFQDLEKVIMDKIWNHIQNQTPASSSLNNNNTGEQEDILEEGTGATATIAELLSGSGKSNKNLNPSKPTVTVGTKTKAPWYKNLKNKFTSFWSKSKSS